MSVRVNRPGKSRGLGVIELWQSRELLYFLAWRDLKVRYKQTVLGALWALLQPLLMAAVFTVLFARLARTPSDGLPYPAFAYSGLVLWQLFSSALMESSNSVVANERLLTKAAFPRLTIPLASVVTPIIDSAVASVVLVGFLAWFRISPPPTIMLLPAFLLLSAAAALALGVWFAALNVRYRDVRYIVPFVVQPLLFLTPVAYPASLVPVQWRTLYAMNPMVGITEGVRWCVFGIATEPARMLTISLGVTALMLFGGVRYFRRAEREFADVI
jgi:lipopolysaccharide transport system permease protein